MLRYVHVIHTWNVFGFALILSRLFFDSKFFDIYRIMFLLFFGLSLTHTYEFLHAISYFHSLGWFSFCSLCPVLSFFLQLLCVLRMVRRHESISISAKIVLFETKQTIKKQTTLWEKITQKRREFVHILPKQWVQHICDIIKKAFWNIYVHHFNEITKEAKCAKLAYTAEKWECNHSVWCVCVHLYRCSKDQLIKRDEIIYKLYRWCSLHPCLCTPKKRKELNLFILINSQ